MTYGHPDTFVPFGSGLLSRRVTRRDYGGFETSPLRRLDITTAGAITRHTDTPPVSSIHFTLYDWGLTRISDSRPTVVVGGRSGDSVDGHPPGVISSTGTFFPISHGVPVLSTVDSGPVVSLTLSLPHSGETPRRRQGPETTGLDVSNPRRS